MFFIFERKVENHEKNTGGGNPEPCLDCVRRRKRYRRPNPSAKPEAEQSGKLNIYNWSDYVDPETVAAFEKETGIKMRSDYYDSNETLEAKVLTGKSGYDLTAPSIANALLKKSKRARIRKSTRRKSPITATSIKIC